VTIPKSFDCMGFEIKVVIDKIRDAELDGHYSGAKQKITISNESNAQVQHQTFWHEWMHCALTTLGYSDLNKDEQFVDQMAQCLYQLEKTRRSK